MRNTAAVKTSLALGLPVCSFENGLLHVQGMVDDCPIVIPFSRPDKTRNSELFVEPVFCIIDTRSCSFWSLYLSL